MVSDMDKGEKISELLHDPTDPAGKRILAENAAVVSAMLEAASIDPRLPRIIYLRRAGVPLRVVGMSCKISGNMVHKILKKLTPNLMIECGLRRI